MLAETFKATVLAKLPDIEGEFDLDDFEDLRFTSGNFEVQYLAPSEFYRTSKPTWIVGNRVSEGRGDTLDEAFNNFLGVKIKRESKEWVQSAPLW